MSEQKIFGIFERNVEGEKNLVEVEMDYEVAEMKVSMMEDSNTDFPEVYYEIEQLSVSWKD